MEKRITIGRGDDCDIVIPDDSDNVSRHHMVITFGFTGKMKISDTSSNGTFINDNRMLKGSSVPVTRSDKIRLGAKWTLDWTLVHDPFATARRVAAALAAVLLVLAVAAGIYCATRPADYGTARIVVPKAADDAGSDSWNADSTLNNVPTEKTIDIGGVRRAAAGKKKVVRKESTARKSSPKKSKAQGAQAKKAHDSNSKDEMIIKRNRDLSHEKDMTI